MKFFTAISTAIYLTAVAQGANVKLCKKPHLKDCRTVTVHDNACFNFPNDLDQKVSSLDTNGAQCTFWKQKQCDGQHWKAHGKHETIPGDFNNKLRSVKCN